MPRCRDIAGRGTSSSGFRELLPNWHLSPPSKVPRDTFAELGYFQLNGLNDIPDRRESRNELFYLVNVYACQVPPSRQTYLTCSQV